MSAQTSQLVLTCSCGTRGEVYLKSAVTDFRDSFFAEHRHCVPGPSANVAVVPIYGHPDSVARPLRAAEAREPLVIAGVRYISDPVHEPALRYSPDEARAMREALRRLDRGEGR